MEQHSPLMVVLQDAGEQEFANQLATAMGYTFADVVIGVPADAAQAIMTRGVSPAYIMLDIASMPAAEVIAQLEQMAEYCDPHTRVVVIGQLNDITLYRELKARGVIEYFTRPVDINNLRAALMTQNPEMASSIQKQPRDECSIVTFMSAASGDGSSTVALNTAYALAHEFNQPTVIIDMDYQFGMIARNLDQSCQFGIKDIFEYPDRIIDSTLIEKMLATHLHEQNLKVIAAPNDLRILPPIKPEVIRSLIATLKSQFKFIIIDLPHIWSPWVAAALGEANHSVIVAQLWLRSVTHSSRMLKSWREIGIDTQRTSVVINRSGAKFKEAVTEKDYERVCGINIQFALANDTKSVITAENQGKTVMEIGGSPLAGQFKDLAGYLISKRDGTTYVPDSAAGKASLASLFQRK
jgi:pilus assembly protein CpaE